MIIIQKSLLKICDNPLLDIIFYHYFQKIRSVVKIVLFKNLILILGVHEETSKQTLGLFAECTLNEVKVFLLDEVQGVPVSQIDFLQLIKYLLVNKSDVVLHRLVKHNVHKFLGLYVCSIVNVIQVSIWHSTWILDFFL